MSKSEGFFLSSGAFKLLSFFDLFLYLSYETLIMSRKIIFYISASYLLLFSKVVNAQLIVRLFVHDSTDHPLQSVTCIANDSIHTYSGITDATGRTVLHLAHPGTYDLHLSLIGYQRIDTQLQVHKSEETFSYTLQASSKKLSEIIVRTTNISISHDAEKFIVHFVNPHFIQGRSIWDILKSSPLIQIDNQDNLSILDNNQVIIYINGKRQYVDIDALIELLKARPADDIQQLEIVPMPTAQYNAPAGSAVINIVMKKFNDYTKGYVNTRETFQSLLSESISAGLSHQKNKWSYSIDLSGSNLADKFISKSSLTSTSKKLAWNMQDTVTRKKFYNFTASFQVSYQAGENSQLSFSHFSAYTYEDPSYGNNVSWVRYTMNPFSSIDLTTFNRQEKIRFYRSSNVFEYNLNNSVKHQSLDMTIGYVYVWNYSMYPVFKPYARFISTISSGAAEAE